MLAVLEGSGVVKSLFYYILDTLLTLQVSQAKVKVKINILSP